MFGDATETQEQEVQREADKLSQVTIADAERKVVRRLEDLGGEASKSELIDSVEAPVPRVVDAINRLKSKLRVEEKLDGESDGRVVRLTMPGGNDGR